MTAERGLIMQKNSWKNKNAVIQTGLFVFASGVISSALFCSLNTSLRGSIFPVVIGSYLMMSLLFQVVGLSLKRISWKSYPLILLAVVVFPVAGIRSFQKITYFEDYRSEASNLMELDRDLWEGTDARVLLRYQPELLEKKLSGVFSTEPLKSLEDVEILFARITGEPVAVSLRFGHWDFAFRERSLYIFVGNEETTR